MLFEQRSDLRLRALHQRFALEPQHRNDCFVEVASWHEEPDGKTEKENRKQGSGTGCRTSGAVVAYTVAAVGLRRRTWIRGIQGMHGIHGVHGGQGNEQSGVLSGRDW